MPFRYQFTSIAIDDLDRIWSFIAADSQDAADRVEAAVFDACEMLSRNPMLGSKRIELTARPVRFWTVTHFPNFVVVYRPDTRPLRIIRVLHGKRNLARILLRE